MAKKKQKSFKNKVGHLLRKYWWLGLLIIMIIACLIGWSYLKYEIDRKALNESGIQLVRLVNDFRYNAQIVALFEAEMVCTQPNLKYDDGPISCGTNIDFVDDNTSSFTADRQLILDTIKSNNYFSVTDSGRITTAMDGSRGYVVRFAPRDDHRISCLVWPHFYEKQNNTKYSFSCSKTAPSFLPGYTRE